MSISRLREVSVGIVVVCLLIAPGLARAGSLATAAPQPVATSSVKVEVDDSAQRIDATYTTTDDTLYYRGQFFDDAQGAPESFTASVESAKGGTFAEGTFERDHFWLRLGAVEIDSSSPITQQQADLIAAFAASDDATQLRKAVQAFFLEAPGDARYLLALTAMVMVVDAGAGAGLEAQAAPGGLAAAAAGDDCFGCCGPGCWGCTGCYTKACEVHDQCVKDHGHLDLRCLIGLIPAILSLIAECLLNPAWWLA